MRAEGREAEARSAVGERRRVAVVQIEDGVRAPVPGSGLERDVVSRLAEAVEDGDVDGVVALLTDDA